MGNVIYLLNILEQEFDNFLLSLERPSRQNKIKIIITCTKSDKSLQSQSRLIILVRDPWDGEDEDGLNEPWFSFLFAFYSELGLIW